MSPVDLMSDLNKIVYIRNDIYTLNQTSLVKQISILRRFNYQDGVKISQYGKCFLSVVQRASDLDKIIIKDFFGLIEQLLDPRRNWRDQNCSQDSVCRLLGSIGDFIEIIIHFGINFF